MQSHLSLTQRFDLKVTSRPVTASLTARPPENRGLGYFNAVEINAKVALVLAPPRRLNMA
jgi:hypothetical protein